VRGATISSRVPSRHALAERVDFAPIWENAPINGVGPRAEAAVTMVTAYPDTVPFEELRLKERR
jgi:hypothetical protein